MENTITTIEPKKSKSLDIGKSFYGETYERFMRVGELMDALPAFKELYYTRKIGNPQATNRDIIMEFNEAIVPRKFHPYTQQLKQWTRKWDADILAQMRMKDGAITTKKEVYQVIKTRDENDNIAIAAPDDNSLESGVRTLGGELLNDAMQMLKEDQDREDIFDQEELMRRRNYVVGVFAHTTRMVQGKAGLLLKASKESRESAGFLMDLLRRATSGKMTTEELDFLKTSAPIPTPIQHVEQNV